MSKQSKTVEVPNNETYNSVISVYKAMRRSMAEELSREGLTPPQFGLLRVIAKREAIPLNRISQEMLVTPPNITGVVDRLEAKHLVRRVVNKEDRRATIVELTYEGRRLQELVAKRYDKFMKEILSEFTRSEQETLRNLLLKLEEKMLRKKK
ncbi:MAG: MarR family transcriptional regulator [Nitrososphaerota archaeon]|nr:MarR family transcriptional regulator [Nitrososphaerota archaeon]MDG6922080.1 MarR family transcriptional regulator [Nitrososphaerota archaeon]